MTATPGDPLGDEPGVSPPGVGSSVTVTVDSPERPPDGVEEDPDSPGTATVTVPACPVVPAPDHGSPGVIVMTPVKPGVVPRGGTVYVTTLGTDETEMPNGPGGVPLTPGVTAGVSPAVTVIVAG